MQWCPVAYRIYYYFAAQGIAAHWKRKTHDFSNAFATNQ